MKNPNTFNIETSPQPKSHDTTLLIGANALRTLTNTSEPSLDTRNPNLHNPNNNYLTIEDMEVAAAPYGIPPFVSSPSDECLPAAIGAALGALRPHETYDRPALRALSGYVKDYGAAAGVAIPRLYDLGLEIIWASEDADDLPDTEEGIKMRLRQNFPDEAAYQKQLAYLHDQRLKDSIEANKRLMSGLLDDGVTRYTHALDSTGIKELIDDAYLVLTSLDGAQIYPDASDQPPDPHSILIFGYGTVPNPETGQAVEAFLCHNADGMYGNVPCQAITFDRLEHARVANSPLRMTVALRDKRAVLRGP